MALGARGRRGRPLSLLVLIAGGCSVLPEVAPLVRADAIVVLGNRPPTDEQGNVRPETRRRVEAGVEAHRRGLAPMIVMSGGKTGERVESKVMADFAVTLGVPRRAIFEESRSTSTITNARYSIRLLRDRLERSDVSVIVVSSPYHLARARLLFECAGARVQIHGTAIPGSLAYRFGFTLYEWMQRIVYLFIDECSEVRGEDAPRSFRGIL